MAIQPNWQTEDGTKSRVMRESAIGPVVAKWLESRGLRAVPELRVRRGPVDLVGVGDGELIAVEMKRSFTSSVAWKMRDNAIWADEVWLAVGSKPRKATIELCRSNGWGVFIASVGVVVPACKLRHETTGFFRSSRWRDRAFEKSKRADMSVIAGFPTLKGDGPRIRCTKAIREYMASHPSAKSREVFANVPNHYATFASFSSCFGAFIRGLRTPAALRTPRIVQRTLCEVGK